jgi:hypothetical protein
LIFGLVSLHGKDVTTKITVSATERIVVVLLGTVILHCLFGYNHTLLASFTFEFLGRDSRFFLIGFFNLLLHNFFHLLHDATDEQICCLSQSHVGEQVVWTNSLDSSERAAEATLGKSVTNTSLTSSSSL